MNFSKYLFLGFFAFTGYAFAEIENPGVSVDGLEYAGAFKMPFGNRSSIPTLTLSEEPFGATQNLTRTYRTSFFEYSFLDPVCEQFSGQESNGWYLTTPHNSDRLYSGEPYSSRGSYHPGEDWNGFNGGNTDGCQDLYALANGVVLAKGYSDGYGYMVFVLHRLRDDSFIVSVFAHLIDVNDVEVGDVVNSETRVGRVGNSGESSWYAHLHWEIRTDDFLEFADEQTIRLLEGQRTQLDPFHPEVWPAAIFPDNGAEFINSYYLAPTAFVLENETDREPVSLDPRYYSFNEGDPALPGDGIFIQEGEGDAHYTFVTPIPVSGTEGVIGSTVSVFMPHPGFTTWRLGAVFRAEGSCVASTETGTFDRDLVTFSRNGVFGFYISTSGVENQEYIDHVRTECGADIAVEDIEFIGINLVNTTTNEIIPLDAFYFGWGENVLPPEDNGDSGGGSLTLVATSTVTGPDSRTVSDFSITFEDDGDGILEYEEISEFTGVTQDSNDGDGPYTYRAIAAIPDIPGISTAGGFPVFSNYAGWQFCGSNVSGCGSSDTNSLAGLLVDDFDYRIE